MKSRLAGVPREKVIYRNSCYIYTKLPAKQQVAMPSFILKVLDMPASTHLSAEDIRQKLKPLYDKKSSSNIIDDVNYVKNDKNVHAVMVLNTRINLRR